jgi:hypothetical protein
VVRAVSGARRSKRMRNMRTVYDTISLICTTGVMVV